MANSKNSSKNRPKNFRFRKNANIGAYDALEDVKYLSNCFVDTGEMDLLKDTENPICAVIGRTGSGKTALLERFNSFDHAIKLSPDALALSYVSNNQIIRFFVELGVNMDLFYRLLWRHILVVEILKARFQIVNRQTQANFLETWLSRLTKKNKAKEEAIQYLTEWGEEFWKETDYRVKEIVNKMGSSLEQIAGTALNAQLTPAVSGDAHYTLNDAKTLSEETKQEVIHRGQAVVEKVQIAKLNEMMRLLEDDILIDKQKIYYITIDRLDENWVNDELRYQLIRALLETAREFNKKLSCVKVIIAVREDLLGRVFRYTRDAGYQEEKYKSMYLSLSWSQKELEELLDRRVNFLIREQYTTQDVKLRDILPNKINKTDSIKYILDRTMLRPRDAIAFLNECLHVAEGRATITQENVYAAETGYSENRLRALADEWFSDYQSLIELTLTLLKKRPKSFKLKDFTQQELENFLIDILTQTDGKPEDEILQISKIAFERGKTSGLLETLLGILHKVGVIGVKPESYTGTMWSFQNTSGINYNFNEDTIFQIHPAFWRVLGIKP